MNDVSPKNDSPDDLTHESGTHVSHVHDPLATRREPTLAYDRFVSGLERVRSRIDKRTV